MNACFQFEFLPRQSHNRSVRFDEGSAAAIASHDYRIAHASGKSDTRHLETQLLHTLKKSGTHKSFNAGIFLLAWKQKKNVLAFKMPLLGNEYFFDDEN